MRRKSRLYDYKGAILASELDVRITCQNYMSELHVRITCQNYMSELHVRITCQNYMSELHVRIHRLHNKVYIFSSKPLKMQWMGASLCTKILEDAMDGCVPVYKNP